MCLVACVLSCLTCMHRRPCRCTAAQKNMAILTNNDWLQNEAICCESLQRGHPRKKVSKLKTVVEAYTYSGAQRNQKVFLGNQMFYGNHFENLWTRLFTTVLLANFLLLSGIYIMVLLYIVLLLSYMDFRRPQPVNAIPPPHALRWVLSSVYFYFCQPVCSSW